MNDPDVIKRTVLIVDDEFEIRELHKILILHAGFNVVEAENGIQALEMLNQVDHKIDAILSDIIMPEMNGYEFCAKVKENEVLKEIPFIFISSLSTLEEKTKGYSYGADDYIIKPLEASELALKIKNLIRRRESNQALSLQVAESRDAAMQIMNFYADLGQVLEFYKSSTNAKNLDELVVLLFEVTTNFGLCCTFQIHLGTEILNFGDRGEVSPLEADVIELAREKDRFYSFGSRLIISFDTFSLLIKNMPADEERAGTLRDSLGVLCNAIEAKLSGLISQSANSKKSEIAGFILDVLSETQATFSVIEDDNKLAINGLMTDIEDAFISLGLSESQEENIREIVNSCEQKVNLAFKQSQTLNAMFDDIRGNLDEIRGS